MGNTNSSKNGRKSSTRPDDKAPTTTLTNKDKKKSSTSSSKHLLPPPSWNRYLGTHANIFPADLDVIKSNLTNGPALKSELGKILGVPDNVKRIYKNFAEHHNISNGRDSSVDREAVFKSNLMHILEHNVEFFNGRSTWKKAVNHFADWTEEEFHKMSTGSIYDIPPSTTDR